MAEVLIAQAVAFAVAGTTTTLVGRAGPYNPDFPPGEIFVVLFLAGLIPLAGLAAGVLAGTAFRTRRAHCIERRPIH
ncbi:MAG TPA: hypothetical protein VFL61_06055 [Gaiellaceae bacterium]|nr:hypothetical protein [Gaiellaceae bacterium]